MNISIKQAEEEICCCNSCYAKNYDDGISDKKVDVLYDVLIGNTLSCLCHDCLVHLVDQATEILNK